MKIRVYILAALAAMTISSCTLFDESEFNRFSVCASINCADDGTRLDYSETQQGITPAWKVGDQILGYDDCGVKFLFTVSSVTDDGIATVDTGEYWPGLAKILYAIYYPGKGVDDIVDESVAVDLGSQSGVLDSGFPLIMTATGRIRDGKVSLAFKVESAIVGVRQIKVPDDATITGMVVTGVKTTGNINSIHGMTEVAPDKEAGRVEVPFNGAPVFISVLPAPDAQIGLTAIADDGTEYAVQTSIPETEIAAGNYYYTSKEMGESVAEIIETGELFADIHQAVDRANSSKLDSVTLKLRKEISITDSLVLENGNGCLIKIDFNGHTITGGAEGHNLIRVRNNAVFEDNSPEGDGGVSVTIANKYTRAVYFNWNDCYLHVKGGRYSSKSETGVFYFRGMHSKLTFFGGTVENTRSAGGSAVYIYGSTGISGTINGGEFINRNGGTYAAISNNAAAELEVNGGYFHNGSSTGKPVTNAIVSRGYFNKEIDADMLASGSSCTPETTVHEGLTYNYTVERIDVVAEIVETGDVFSDIHQAVDFVNASEADAVTLKLRKDVNIADSLVLQNVKENLITIDFNGHTITNDVKGHNTIRIKNKNVVFEDNSPEGNGGVSNEYANIYSRAVYVLWDNCNLTIKGGYYSAKSENGAIYFRGIGSKLTFSGGTVENLRGAGGSAVYVYGSSKIGGTINDGVFINRNGGSYAAVSYHGSAKLVVNGGYFHNGSSTGNPVTNATVYGGFFSKEIPADLVAPGFSCKKQPTEHEGLTYDYAVTGATVFGYVRCDGNPVPGVVVTDGYEFTETDSDGLYKLNSDKEYGFVEISIPSGYRVPSGGVIPQFFARLTGAPGSVEQHDFALKMDADQTKHTMLFFTDIHLAGRIGDVSNFKMFESDINSYMAEHSSENIFGATMGDMTFDTKWDQYKFYPSDYVANVDSAFASSNLQIFHCIGNHDHEKGKKGAYPQGEIACSKKYKDAIGPNFYSYNIGKIHYVCLDNIYCTNDGTGDTSYDCIVEDYMLDWLKKDLSYVEESTPIVLQMHAPIFNYKGEYYRDKDGNKDKLIAALEGRTTYVLSGHTHMLYTIDRLDDLHLIDLNSGSVCGTWWVTQYYNPAMSLNREGTPAGYRIFKVDGTNVTWQYKAYGRSADEQIRTYDLNSIDLRWQNWAPNINQQADTLARYADDVSPYNKSFSNNNVFFVIYDYDPKWQIEVYEDGVARSWETWQIKDPLHLVAYETIKYDRHEYPDSGYMTMNNFKMFRVACSSAKSTVTIKATDRFGRTYTETMTRPKPFAIAEYSK